MNLLEIAQNWIKATGHEVNAIIENEYGVCLEIDGVESVIFREENGELIMEHQAKTDAELHEALKNSAEDRKILSELDRRWRKRHNVA